MCGKSWCLWVQKFHVAGDTDVYDVMQAIVAKAIQLSKRDLFFGKRHHTLEALNPNLWTMISQEGPMSLLRFLCSQIPGVTGNTPCAPALAFHLECIPTQNGKPGRPAFPNP